MEEGELRTLGNDMNLNGLDFDENARECFEALRKFRIRICRVIQSFKSKKEDSLEDLQQLSLKRKFLQQRVYTTTGGGTHLEMWENKRAKHFPDPLTESFANTFSNEGHLNASFCYFYLEGLSSKSRYGEALASLFVEDDAFKKFQEVSDAYHTAVLEKALEIKKSILNDSEFQSICFNELIQKYNEDSKRISWKKNTAFGRETRGPNPFLAKYVEWEYKKRNEDVITFLEEAQSLVLILLDLMVKANQSAND